MSQVPDYKAMISDTRSLVNSVVPRIRLYLFGLQISGSNQLEQISHSDEIFQEPKNHNTITGMCSPTNLRFSGLFSTLLDCSERRVLLLFS